MARTTVTVGRDSYEIPQNNADPGYGEDLHDFNVAVADVLGSISGTYDIPKSTFAILDDQSTKVSITGFSFNSTVTRSFAAGYVVYRASGFEAGKITGVYNGSAWEYSVEHDGDAGIDFSVLANGQVQYKTDALYGAGEIQFQASTLDVI